MAAVGSVGFGKTNDMGAYFAEVAQHFGTIEDAEEKALLAENVVEEVRLSIDAARADAAGRA